MDMVLFVMGLVFCVGAALLFAMWVVAWIQCGVPEGDREASACISIALAILVLAVMGGAMLRESGTSDTAYRLPAQGEGE